MVGMDLLNNNILKGLYSLLMFIILIKNILNLDEKNYFDTD